MPDAPTSTGIEKKPRNPSCRQLGILEKTKKRGFYVIHEIVEGQVLKGWRPGDYAQISIKNMSLKARQKKVDATATEKMTWDEIRSRDCLHSLKLHNGDTVTLTHTPDVSCEVASEKLHGIARAKECKFSEGISTYARTPEKR